jgi:hypothetical protein
MDDFMYDRGFPYKVSNMHQMFNMLRSGGGKRAVVANVEDNYYIGYYDPIEATNIAAAARRIRKYRVIDVAVL